VCVKLSGWFRRPLDALLPYWALDESVAKIPGVIIPAYKTHTCGARNRFRWSHLCSAYSRMFQQNRDAERFREQSLSPSSTFFPLWFPARRWFSKLSRSIVQAVAKDLGVHGRIFDEHLRRNVHREPFVSSFLSNVPSCSVTPQFRLFGRDGSSTSTEEAGSPRAVVLKNHDGQHLNASARRILTVRVDFAQSAK